MEATLRGTLRAFLLYFVQVLYLYIYTQTVRVVYQVQYLLVQQCTIQYGSWLKLVVAKA